MSAVIPSPGTMPADVARRIRMLDRNVTPELIQAAQDLYVPLHEKPPYAGVKITRDHKYGPAQRNRLDIYEPEPADRTPRPILMFVHGGGFVAGDKWFEGTPYYDNVGLWAVRNGYIGVTMTHRLAPDDPWPAANEDLAAAIEWTANAAASHGGDAERIFLMGQSAGAAHSASYVAHPEFHGPSGVRVSGVILLSGLYNITTMEMRPNLEAYYGTDPALYAERSSITGLMHSSIPLMIVVAEMEPTFFHTQGIELLGAICQRDRACPRFLSLVGHNHLTEIFHLNSGENLLGSQIREFIRVGR